MNLPPAPTRFRVRTAWPGDVPALTDLLNEIIRAGGTTALEIEMDTQEVARMFVDGAGVLACHVATGIEDDAPLGFQTLARHPDLPEGWGDIATFTRRGLQQAGLGRALFAATRATAQTLGLTAINAAIRADNEGGLAYYSRMGFVTYPTLPAVPLRSRQLVDRIFKRHDLG